MYVQVYTYAWLNISCFWNDICIFVFRAKHLALDKQLIFSSLGKATFPKSRFFFLLPIDFCIRLRPHGIFLILTAFHFVSFLFGSCLCAHVGEIFVDIIFVIARRHYLKTSYMIYYCLLQSFVHASIMFSKSQVWESWLDVSTGTGQHSSEF